MGLFYNIYKKISIKIIVQIYIKKVFIKYRVQKKIILD